MTHTFGLDQIADAFALARNIAEKVAEEMTFPGEIRVTVLRDGRLVATLRTADTNATEVTHLMVGRTTAAAGAAPTMAAKPGILPSTSLMP